MEPSSRRNLLKKIKNFSLSLPNNIAQTKAMMRYHLKSSMQFVKAVWFGLRLRELWLNLFPSRQQYILRITLKSHTDFLLFLPYLTLNSKSNREPIPASERSVEIR